MKNKGGRPPRATREQLYQAYIVDRLTLKEIQKKFGYHWSQNVTQALKYFHIEHRATDAQARWELPLSSEQRQVAIGTLLGDAHIKRPPGTKHYSLAMGHCTEQLEYLKWKLEMFKPFASGKIQPHRQRSFHQGQTYTHPAFTELDKHFYYEGKKILPVDLLNELDYLGIAVWYMDDGSYRPHRASIATCGFGYEGTGIVAEWFTGKGLPAKRYSNGDDEYIVQFSSLSTSLLHENISNYIHPCMEYKISQNPCKIP